MNNLLFHSVSNTQQLISSVLSDRSIAVVVENHLSFPKCINIGVPWGSLLSTTLFLFIEGDTGYNKGDIDKVLSINN